MIKLRLGISQAAVLAYDKKPLRKVMRQAGSEVAAVARSLIRRKTAERKKVGITGSAPGEPPGMRSGELLRGIVVRPYKSGEGVAIRDTVFYALFLEHGAVGGGRKGGNGVKNLHRDRKGKTLQKRQGKPQTFRVLLPRPFLSTALAQRQGSLEKRIKAAVLEGIAFKRVKA